MKQAGVDLDYVVEIDVDDAEIVKRLSGRRTHLPFRAHLSRGVPAAQGGGQGRSDARGSDPSATTTRKETIIKRCSLSQQTKQLIDYYRPGGTRRRVRRSTASRGTGSAKHRERIFAALS